MGFQSLINTVTIKQVTITYQIFHPFQGTPQCPGDVYGDVYKSLKSLEIESSEIQERNV